MKKMLFYFVTLLNLKSLALRMIIRIMSSVLLFVALDSFALAKNRELYQKFEYIFEKVEDLYVEDVDKDKLLRAAISGMINALDPHSEYYSPTEMKSLMEQAKGEFGGIGIEMIRDDGLIKVISAIDDTPAYNAGIKPDDYIVVVNDEYVREIGFIKAADNIRGKPGTEVKIKVFREGEVKLLEFNIKRDSIKQKVVKLSMHDNIAYIRVTYFNQNVIDELKAAMKALGDVKSITGMILDLRNNPGGDFYQGLALAEYFLESEKIVTVKERNNSKQKDYFANKFSAKAPNVPMVVLVNGASVSAAEIVAAALKDNKRAILLGTRTFGKASVQPLLEFNDGWGLKITNALYYTPNGTSIQAKGIDPDIDAQPAKVEKYDTAKMSLFNEESYKNHVKNPQASDKSDKGDKKDLKDVKDAKDKNIDDVKKTDTKVSGSRVFDAKYVYENDYQYARAYDLLKGLAVLGK